MEEAVGHWEVTGPIQEELNSGRNAMNLNMKLMNRITLATFLVAVVSAAFV